MSETIPRLRVARPGDPPRRMPLNQAAAMCVDSAELFVLSLDGEELTSDGGLRAAYLLGLAEAHLVSPRGDVMSERFIFGGEDGRGNARTGVAFDSPAAFAERQYKARWRTLAVGLGILASGAIKAGVVQLCERFPRAEVVLDDDDQAP